VSDIVVELALPQVIRLGDQASLSKTISESDVHLFAALSLDYNPVHLDDSFAAQTRFGRRIVHGAIGMALVSAVLGTKLPGPGSIYVSQTVQYKAPVYIGDTVTASVKVIKVRPDRNLLTLQTEVHTQNGTLVLTGESLILLERDGVIITE
jgi:3-hydroxybutyryl-CoA dehydratase